MKYVVNGGKQLSGTIAASGNKNSALPCLAAVLLTEEEVLLKNIPDLQDVKVMIKILSSLGVSVHKESDHVYRLKACTITDTHIPQEFAEKIRASILCVGPMLARCGEVHLPPPGGDVIGRRRIDTHIHSLSALGGKFKMSDTFEFSSKQLKGTPIFQDEASVTATENTIMAAVLAKGKTTIENAACEPHVQDLCHMLNSMGSYITGIGSNVLHIDGVEKLYGTEFSIGPDFMEVGSFIGLAAVTHSIITITNTEPLHMKMAEIVFGKLGITWSYDGSTITMSDKSSCKVVSDIGNAIPTIADAPWPGFPADLTSIALVVATQVVGTVLIHEKMFESRMFFVDKLVGMGARIILCDPHRAVVNGPTTLVGTQLSSPDVRAGMAMVIAALCAHGESVINNIYEIERGYETLVARLTALGADITKRN